MKRKLLWRLIAAFFALLIVCTVIANAVYNAKLPVVTLTSAATMTLEESTTVAGDVYEEGGTLYVRYSLSAEDREKYETPDVGKASVKTVVTDAETGNESLLSESLDLYAYTYHYNEGTGLFDVVAEVAPPVGELVFREGATVDLAIGVYVPYTTVVPSYCLRSDAEGDFIFVLGEQKSLFGVENYVLRMSTEVEARSGMYVALSYFTTDPIVATSSLPIESGDVVVVR